MEVVSIERSTYEELLTSFNSFVTKMKEMGKVMGTASKQLAGKADGRVLFGYVETILC